MCLLRDAINGGFNEVGAYSISHHFLYGFISQQSSALSIESSISGHPNTFGCVAKFLFRGMDFLSDGWGRKYVADLLPEIEKQGDKAKAFRFLDEFSGGAGSVLRKGATEDN